MIGIDIREITVLKILQPICEYFIANKIKYKIFHMDKYLSSKEYNRASQKNLGISCKYILNNAQAVVSYNNNNQIVNKLQNHGITKFVGIELFLCYSGLLDKMKKIGIKTYSILYLTDSLWRASSKDYMSPNRIYFNSEFLMEKALLFTKTTRDPNRHMFLGSPIYDQLANIKSQNNVLVMLPNLTKDKVNVAFGSEKRFLTIIDNITKNNKVIFKTRKKQWLPSDIKAKNFEIIMDGVKMYPSAIVQTFNRCNLVVMFGSSGVYEAMAAKKPVINIPIPFARWRWDARQMKKYFTDSGLYNYPKAIITVTQQEMLQNTLPNMPFNPEANKEWQDKFIGPIDYHGAINIAKDILKN